MILDSYNFLWRESERHGAVMLLQVLGPFIHFHSLWLRSNGSVHTRRKPRLPIHAERAALLKVIEMETCLNELNNGTPARKLICALAEKFSASPDRAGKSTVQPKQVWNWFQNKRYSQRAKVKLPGKLNAPPLPPGDPVKFRHVGDSAPFRSVGEPSAIAQGQNSVENTQLEFEAKSARDGAWYDVSVFLSPHRIVENDDVEVRVRFSGFGVEEDEWINVHRCVRLRSLPCENGECIAVLPGDLVLCFQEGKEQALYYDAHVLDAQRRRHDIRGCRCRFLVRYDHDQSEEIVPLRKVCRRPETGCRLRQFHASRPSGSADLTPQIQTGSSRDHNLVSRRIRKWRTGMELSADELATIALPAPLLVNYPTTVQTETVTAKDDDYGKALPNKSIKDKAFWGAL